MDYINGEVVQQTNPGWNFSEPLSFELLGDFRDPFFFLMSSFPTNKWSLLTWKTQALQHISWTLP